MKKKLAEYARKRDFKKTAEPLGAKNKKAAAKQGKLIFVVQEHHASHLHYDFRLEWQGVLKSWAVPKGPSLDPAQKRLAVEVEDHPLDYASFTGSIPKGEYGGGEVFRWDMGTWNPIKDPTEGLKKGRLEFTLKGKKLKGDWVMVRTGRPSSKPQWLLIKRHDAFATTAEFPKSVVKAESKAKPKSVKKKPTPSKEIGFVKPQLAELVKRPPPGGDWVHEIKFDGYRIQAHLLGSKVKLYTRNGHDWTDKYKRLAKSLRRLKSSAVLDGELVWQDDQGRSDFGELQRAMKADHTDELIYWVFDILHLNGSDLSSLPLIARKERLEKLVAQIDDPQIKFSEHFRESGDKMLHASCQMHLEGIISKRVDAPYQPGQRGSWTKAKCTKRQEFVIGGFTEAAGSRLGFGALLLGVYDQGQLRYCGRVGTGFDSALLLDLRKRLNKIESKTSLFELASPSGRDIHYVQPRLVAEVSYSEITRDGSLRAPVFHGLRADKAPTEIGIEQEADVPTKIKSKKKPAKSAAPMGAAKAKVQAKVTHPDRIVYVKEKITKQTVANFFAEVGEWMLPHIANRPISALRCTDNSTDACFFNKHFPGKLPENIVPVPEKGKAPFFTVTNTAGINALIQYGTLEIHPWNCHAPKLELPDQIVMDFDPDPTVGFEAVKEGAFELREIFRQLGLESFVKLTGGKGLHVQIPFTPKHDWATIKNFSKTLALEMVSRHPDGYTANVMKKARSGKIFLDYLRNGRGSTAVAPYCLRAREQSAVSMPVDWDELKKLKSGDMFSLEKALAYLKKRRHDPWADYYKVKQSLKLLG